MLALFNIIAWANLQVRRIEAFPTKVILSVAQFVSRSCRDNPGLAEALGYGIDCLDGGHPGKEIAHNGSYHWGAFYTPP
jgi:hypothetical protein